MISVGELIKREREACDYLDKKGIRTACLHYQRFFNVDGDGKLSDLSEKERNVPNILYVAKKGTIISTPVSEESLEKARALGQILAEIPFTDSLGIYIKAAEVVRAKLGAVTLADVVDISYADKSEIKKFITRLKKSTTEVELKARREELQSLISQYEDRGNDAERDDLQEKFQSIVEALESGQQELEKGDKESAISEVEESLFQ